MNKRFIFKYEPQSSVKEIFAHWEEAVRSGKKHIQPKNISVINDLAVISRILSKTRLEIFSVIKKRHPDNIHNLSQLVQRDYANVWRDCQVLANCGIIELKRVKQETKPIALYNQIVISCTEELTEDLQLRTTTRKLKKFANDLESSELRNYLTEKLKTQDIDLVNVSSLENFDCYVSRNFQQS